MDTQPNHILTVDRAADLDTVIGALDAFDIRVVCVAADAETTFDQTYQLTLRPRVQIDLPVIEYAIRRTGVDLLDLRRADVAGCVC
jgi:hypothetical protein